MGTAVDARADIYAVGLIAWRTLAGRHPFKADDPRALLMMQATRPVPLLTEAARRTWRSTPRSSRPSRRHARRTRRSASRPPRRCAKTSPPRSGRRS